MIAVLQIQGLVSHVVDFSSFPSNFSTWHFFLFVCWFISGLNIDTRIYQQSDVDVDVSRCIFVSAVSLYICIKSCHDCNNTRFPSFETYVDINNNFPDSLSLLNPFPPILSFLSLQFLFPLKKLEIFAESNDGLIKLINETNTYPFNG